MSTVARGALVALTMLAVVPFRASAGPITCAQPFAALCAPVTYACRYSQDATGGRLDCTFG